MSDYEHAKEALDALANGSSTDSSDDTRSPTCSSLDYQTVIERAIDARDDVDAAAMFVEDIGLSRLEDAVERAESELSALAADGRDALAAFRRYREVAAADHFHCGHDTPLGSGDQEPPK